MKRVWTARSLAAVLGGSLLYFLITVLVMMCGSFSPLFWVFLPAITAAASGWLYLYLAARTPRFGVPVLMNLVVLLLFLAAGELSGWMAVTLAAGAVLAELVRRLGGYESLRAARWSFLPLAFSSSGSPLYIWIDPARTQPAPRKRCPQPMPRRWRACYAGDAGPDAGGHHRGSRHRRMAWEPALETRSGPNPYQKSMSVSEYGGKEVQNENKTGKSPESPLFLLWRGQGKNDWLGDPGFIGEMFGMAPILW